MRKLFSVIAAAGLLTASTHMASAGPTIVAALTSETGFNDQVGYIGQSFTTPGLSGDGFWYNVSFNFYSDVPAMTPAAFGRGYLFYSGVAADTRRTCSAHLGPVPELCRLPEGCTRFRL